MELGTPLELLDNEQSHLTSLVKSTSPGSWQALYRMAANKASEQPSSLARRKKERRTSVV